MCSSDLGDRMFGDDSSIIGGIGNLDDNPVVVIGHEKGRDTEEKVKRNFGMPQPEGYRKAKRLMKLAEQFYLPVITFIDTSGAYPGIEGEERGQSEAIASNLAMMSELQTPILVVITGEGGSGGALALGIGDHVSMLEYATYSVASPEACSSIVWRSANFASEAADAMKVCAKELIKINVINEIINEPLGGAQNTYNERLDYELSQISSMGFSSYFLIVYDFIEWSKSNDVPVGPGRGSAAGSIVSELLTFQPV